jgi:hypothetical protein
MLKNSKTAFFILCAALALASALPAGCNHESPNVKILSPETNVFAIGDFTINAGVTNFNVVDKQGQAAVKGEGHLHYFMDVSAPTASGKPAVTAAGTWVTTTALSYTWHNVGGGSHTFSVELVNNDHTPLNPPVVSTETVLVIPEIGLPQAVILTPRDGGVVSAGSVTITAQASNFNLVTPSGQPNASHEGHIDYFMDLKAPITPGQPVTGPDTVFASSPQASYTWKKVTAGVHTFSIELVNNDDTPLSPPVVANISVTVQ